MRRFTGTDPNKPKVINTSDLKGSPTRVDHRPLGEFTSPKLARRPSMKNDAPTESVPIRNRGKRILPEVRQFLRRELKQLSTKSIQTHSRQLHFIESSILDNLYKKWGVRLCQKKIGTDQSGILKSIQDDIRTELESIQQRIVPDARPDIAAGEAIERFERELQLEFTQDFLELAFKTDKYVQLREEVSSFAREAATPRRKEWKGGDRGTAERVSTKTNNNIMDAITVFREDFEIPRLAVTLFDRRLQKVGEEYFLLASASRLYTDALEVLFDHGLELAASYGKDWQTTEDRPKVIAEIVKHASEVFNIFVEDYPERG